jgi:aspartyl-tRNA(Asn)/glutamyl-tRNA(Gln) amidotransferase subunit A
MAFVKTAARKTSGGQRSASPMFSLVEATALIRDRKLSSVELTRACLDRIATLNPALNSFITVTADLALQQARQADAELMTGNPRGPLHGIPIALKDLIDVEGVLTTAGSNQYRNRIATEDATIVTQLKRAGAVIVGKTNLHEFAFGGSGIVSAFGPARNPWDPARITGGSSSGSAAAVAAGMCVAAIGTDTAGSVRCPAALCGVVGHRPSRGLISNDGIVPLAQTFDTPGPMTRTVRDAVAILDCLSDSGAMSFSASLDEPVRGLKVGIARNLLNDAAPEVEHCFRAAVATISGLVSDVSEFDLQWETPPAIRSYEIYRYHQDMLRHTPQLYDPRTLDRLRATEGVSEEEYQQGLRELADFNRGVRVFDTVDVVISPTVPVAAPLLVDLETMDSQAFRQYELRNMLQNTFPFSSLWWPSVSVPCGFTSKDLPVGMQISAKPGADPVSLRLAHAYEQATEWHKHVPVIAD